MQTINKNIKGYSINSTMGVALLLACASTPMTLNSRAAMGEDFEPMPVLRSAYFKAEDFKNRRNKLLAKLGGHDVVALMASELDLYSNDTSFPYHPDVHVRYLTGTRMEKTHLIMTKNDAAVDETIFVMEKDPHFETYEGRIPSVEKNQKMTGIKRVLPSSSFKSSLANTLEKMGSGSVLWLDLDRRRRVNNSYPQTPAQKLALEIRQNFPDVIIKNINPILREMREIKSDNEVAALRKASQISAKGHKAAMKRSLTADHEYQVEASLEFTFRDEGASSVGYPSIVGAHANSTILHYGTNNDRLVRDGLMLIDAAAEVEGYSADVTRTWPVDGTFSEAQKDIYGMVLRAQEASIALSLKGNSYQEMVKVSYDIVSKELLALGLISEEKYEQVKLYYLHGIAHGIGLDVHDPLDSTKPLRVNQVYTIEPGVYIRKAVVMDTDVFKALPAKDQKSIAAKLEKYNNIGVRIEDDILITEKGNENLSKDAPRTIAEIEKFLKQP